MNVRHLCPTLGGRGFHSILVPYTARHGGVALEISIHSKTVHERQIRDEISALRRYPFDAHAPSEHHGRETIMSMCIEWGRRMEERGAASTLQECWRPLSQCVGVMHGT